MSTHVYTSITANYLPKARVLANSLKRFHPDFIFHLIFPDVPPAETRLDIDPFDDVMTLDSLNIPDAQRWIFKHSVVEASTGVKGFALLRLLSIPGCSRVLYFDPDIVILSRLDSLIESFERGSILLTPHLTEPENTLEAIRDNEFSVLKHGVYNLGFLGVKNSAQGARFARWWCDRLYDFCYDDIPNGVFTDQRWVDLVPAYFPDFCVLRDPVYNVCTWNLTHRKVEGTLAGGLTANGRRIAFYHFSGLDSGAQEGMLNKYGAGMPALYELREWYLKECDRYGQKEWSGVPWAYSCFDNRVPISSIHRKRYRERIDLQNAFPNPFSTADVNQSFYHWFDANDESRIGVPKPPQPRRGFRSWVARLTSQA